MSATIKSSTSYEPKHISPEQLAKVIAIIESQKDKAVK
jgi:hypothetical protein